MDGRGGSKGGELRRPFGREPPAIKVAAKTDGGGRVRKELEVLRLSDVVVVEEGDTVPGGEELMPVKGLRKRMRCA